MTRITGLGQTSVARPAGRRPAGAFIMPAEDASAAAVGDAAPVAALDPTIALAEAEANAATRDRAAKRQGRALLDLLAALQRAMLAEGAEDALIEDLAARADALPAAADPELAAIVQAVRLRALVEVARRRASEPSAAASSGAHDH